MSLAAQVTTLAARIRDKVNAISARIDTEGVPAGGTTGQVLAKVSSTNYDDHWIDAGSGPAGKDAVLVQSGASYPARPTAGVPVVFVGTANPETLGVMIDGDTWINTDPVAAGTPPVNGSALVWNTTTGIYEGTPASLSVTYAGRTLAGVAPYAGARTKAFDFRTPLYNAESPTLRTIRSRIRGGLRGERATRLAFVGDSKVFGSGLTGGSYTGDDSWPAQFSDLVGGFTGFCVANGSDFRYQSITGFAVAPSNRNDLTTNAGGGSLTFNTRTACVGFKLYGYLSPGGTVTVTTDGGAPDTWTISAGSPWRTFTKSGLSDATHSIAISTAATGFALRGVELTYASGLKVIMDNHGRQSSTASQWNDRSSFITYGTSTFDAITTALPDVCVINLGTNTPTSETDFDSLLDYIVTTKGIPTLLVVPGGLGGTAAESTYDARRSRIYDNADRLDLPVLDFGLVIGNYATANAAALMGDTTHENVRGYSLEALATARALGIVPASLPAPAGLDAPMQSLVNNTASATRIALSATHAAINGVPTVRHRPGTAGLIDWEYGGDGAAGYLFHLRAGVNSRVDEYAIGIGTDKGLGGAILIALKNDGAGVVIGSNPSHTGTAVTLQAISPTANPLDVQMFAGAKGLLIQQKLGAGYADGVSTNASTTFTSATATFTAGDVGQALNQTTSRGEGFVIPSGTTITGFTNSTTVTLSAAATGTATGINFTVGGRAVPTSQRLIQFYNSAAQVLVEMTPSVLNTHTLDAGRAPGSATPDSLYINGGSAKYYVYNGTNYTASEIKADAFAWRVRHYAAAAKGAEASPVLTIESAQSGGSPKLGFFGTSAQNKPAVTGSKATGAALTSLLTSLATLGLITDSTTT